MFCKYCGAAIDDDSLFCKKCGKSLKPDSASKPRPEPKPEPNPEPRPEPRPKPAAQPKSVERPPSGVSFGEAVRLYYVNSINFTGRATRSEYWWIVVYNLLVTFPISLLSGCMQSLIENNLLADESLPLAIVIMILSYSFSLLWSFIHIVPGLSLCFRRLHDVGKTAWSYLLYFIPCAGPFILFFLFCGDSDYDNEWGLSPYEYEDNAETPPEEIVEEWYCDCGRKNNTSICKHCGQPMPNIPEGFWRCGGCGDPVPLNKKVCSCGYHRVNIDVPYHCAKCGRNGPFGNYCPECGSSLKKYHN